MHLNHMVYCHVRNPSQKKNQTAPKAGYSVRIAGFASRKTLGGNAAEYAESKTITNSVHVPCTIARTTTTKNPFGYCHEPLTLRLYDLIS